MPNVILTLICHGATRAVRVASFPEDEPLDPAGLAAADALAGSIRRADTALTSPALRARQTAEALKLGAATDAGLRDLDYGNWSGRSLADVAAADAAGAAAWMADTSSAPHGGETVDAMLIRMAAWLEAAGKMDGRVVAVTHASVIRAAVVTALDAKPISFWRIDVAPLCRVRLRHGPGGWTLVSIGGSGCAQ